jgi:dihydrofolate synthase/folylpolyglutamate synthase
VGVVQALQEVVSDWTLAGLDGARGQSAAELQARLADTAAATAALAGTVEQAMAQVLARAERGDRVLVFGSFHTAAAALQWLQAHA